MNQLLLGASIPFLVAMGVYAAQGFRAGMRWLILTPLGMALGMLYAVVPDLPRLFGMTELYLNLDRDPRMNIFLWHHTIDRLEQPSPIYAVGLVLLLVLLLAAALRELYCTERET